MQNGWKRKAWIILAACLLAGCGASTETVSPSPADTQTAIQTPSIGVEYVGTYGASNGSAVSIETNGTGYTVSITLIRLTALDNGIGTANGDQMTFTATDASGDPIAGTIDWQAGGDAITLTFTDSTWEYLPNGTQYTFTRTTEQAN